MRSLGPSGRRSSGGTIELVADPIERRVELLMLLRRSPPLTRAEIVRTLGSYGPDPDAGRATFERDKRALRGLGVPIRTEISEGDEGATRYTIDPSEYDLEPLDLTPDERLALSMATALVDLDRRWDDDAVRKLGGTLPVTAAAQAALSTPDELPVLHDAVRRRREVRCTYGDRPRTLAPRALAFRHGHWYLVADDAKTRKTFRVDRIVGRVEAGPPGSSAEGDPGPVGLDDLLTTDPLSIPADDEVLAHVRVDGAHARLAARLPGARVVAEDGDGVEVQLRVRNREAVRSWVLGLREHAEITAPAALRDDIVDWLGDMARGRP